MERVEHADVRPHPAPLRARSPLDPRLGAPAVRRMLGWGIVLTLALYFARAYALRYFHVDAATYGPYWWARVHWLLPHVAAGMLALFLGPLQFWTAFRRRYARIHRWSGRAYLAAVGAGAVMAAGMIVRAGTGLIFAWGLAGLAVAWVATSGLALVAIRRGNVPQHREWMVRSYVVTFGFVTFRLLLEALNALEIGATPPERAALASLVLLGRSPSSGDRGRTPRAEGVPGAAAHAPGTPGISAPRAATAAGPPERASDF